MKPTVLFVLPNLSLGGAEQNIVRLIHHLASDCKIHLALIRRSGALSAQAETDATLHDLGGPVRFPFRLVALVRRLAPCIVFSTIADVNLAILLLKRFFPASVRVLIRDAVMPLDLFRGRPSALLMAPLCRLAYVRADRVIVLTERCRSDTIKELGVKNERVVVIHNAYNQERNETAHVAPRTQKDSAIHLISIGRLERQKGYDLLIQSLPGVLAEYPNLRLTIFGDGGERTRLQRDIERLSLTQVVSLAGHVPNPLPALEEASLFVMCSRFEGLSNAMIEALCCGTPVFALNNRENSAEEFIRDGVNGFLSDGGTIEAITRGLSRALRLYAALDRGRIREAARRKFVEDYSLNAYKDVLLHLQERVDRAQP